MDFRRPVAAVVSGVRGRILAVLAETTAELNLRALARLAGVSPAQASRVLPELVALGLVERREVPPAALFVLVDDHVAVPVLRALSRARELALDGLSKLAHALEPPPVSTILFGSFARGEAEVSSDLDVVLVRPDGVSEDDEGWSRSVEVFRVSARRLTGNPVQVVEIAAGEIARRLRSKQPLWAGVARDGIVIQGSSMEQLRGRRSA